MLILYQVPWLTVLCSCFKLFQISNIKWVSHLRLNCLFENRPNRTENLTQVTLLWIWIYSVQILVHCTSIAKFLSLAWWSKQRMLSEKKIAEQYKFITISSLHISKVHYTCIYGEMKNRNDTYQLMKITLEGKNRVEI